MLLGLMCVCLIMNVRDGKALQIGASLYLGLMVQSHFPAPFNFSGGLFRLSNPQHPAQSFTLSFSYYFWPGAKDLGKSSKALEGREAAVRKYPESLNDQTSPVLSPH